MKPILFNTEMVRAIMDGRKTVTRRVIKPQPQSRLAFTCMGHGCGKWGYPSKDAHKYWNDPSYMVPEGMTEEEYSRRWTPPCHTGDILYIRETWRVRDVFGDIARGDRTAEIEYKAGGPTSKIRVTEDVMALPGWNPSIHMPKIAARIFLRVKAVRVERLKAIDADQAKAEGIRGVNLGDGDVGYSVGLWDKTTYDGPVGAFVHLWDCTIKPADLDKYGWNANPWVWVIEFERCEKPVEV